jgi:hypothetical protein
MGLFQLALHVKCTEEFYNLKITGSRIKMEVFILFYKYKGILRSSNVQIKEFVCTEEFVWNWKEKKNKTQLNEG